MRRQPATWAGVVCGSVLCWWVSFNAGGLGLCAAAAAPDLEVFVRAGCPHCEAAKEFLSDLRRERPDISIAVHDVGDDEAALHRLADLAAERGLTGFGVPAFFIGADLIVGFRSAETTGSEIRAALDRRATGLVPPSTVEGIRTRWFGELRVRDWGLPLFTILVGQLDGFNPCAMWVLLFLLSLLVNLRDQLKMALVAGTFVAVSGLVMAGLGTVLLLQPKWLI